MHALQILPLGLASLALAAAATIPTTSLTISIPASHHLPNPNALHPSTGGTLTHKSSPSGSIGVLSAPLSIANTLVFHNVSAGSYLLDVSCGTHAFVPLRVDVLPSTSGSNDKPQIDGGLEVRAWETYRGNDWNNKGEAVPIRSTGATGVLLEARVMGPKAYFMERPAFNVLSIFKNPMILLGLVSMGIFIGMPYLVDNMDPELKAEYEERQKKNPMNGLLSGASGGQTPTPMGNFDMAAYLAGSGQSKGKK